MKVLSSPSFSLLAATGLKIQIIATIRLHHLCWRAEGGDADFLSSFLSVTRAYLSESYSVELALLLIGNGFVRQTMGERRNLVLYVVCDARCRGRVQGPLLRRQEL